MNVIWEASPNYTIGRNGRKVIAIVNHQTGGQCPGSLTWMCNPAAKASAHYLIYRDGKIYQLVKESDTAWHAGQANKPTWSLYDYTNCNRYTIGIEHECYPGVGGDGNLTEEQYQATLWLHQQLIQKYNIPVDRNHIIGHYQIDSVNRPNCPGSNFPWDRLMNDLRLGVIDVALEKWMIEGGQAALKELNEKGLVSDVAGKSSPEVLAQPVPSYLFWMMLARLASYK